MIELVNAEQLAKATERAKAGNLFVQPTSFLRQYRVTNRDTDSKYIVDFFVRKDGKRFGHCSCRAGMNNKACKHLSAAAGYHVARMAAQREAKRIAEMASSSIRNGLTKDGESSVSPNINLSPVRRKIRCNQKVPLQQPPIQRPRNGCAYLVKLSVSPDYFSPLTRLSISTVSVIKSSR